MRLAVRIAWVLALALGALGANAQAERKYAVMSFIGDSLTVVGQEPQTGTHIRKNSEDTLALVGDSMDQMAMQATLQALQQALPGANAVALRAGIPKLYGSQASFVDGDRANLPGEVLSALRAANVTHLILLTKFRADANMQFVQGGRGSGKIQGLGFYIDRYTRNGIQGSGVYGVGYLAAFAYFELTLIDLDAQQAQRKAQVTRSQVVVRTVDTAGRDPWDILDAGQKMAALSQLIGAGVDEAVPKILAVR